MIIELFNRIRRLNIDLQHLVIITFPRTQECYKLYLYLKDCGIFSSKLKTHPTYSKSIIDHLDVPTKTVYYFTNKSQIDYKLWMNKDGLNHRETEGEPAAIYYYKNGQIESQEWWKDGKMHRDTDEPAEISYYETGQIRYEEWWKDGKLHRDTENNDPAFINYYKNGEILEQNWWKNYICIATQEMSNKLI